LVAVPYNLPAECAIGRYSRLVEDEYWNDDEDDSPERTIL